MKDREYHREYSKNYYHKRKQELIDTLGGKCAKCGSTEHLEFDHIDPENKSFNISKLLNHSKHEVEDEIKKCQLLCNKCHSEKSKIDIRRKNSGTNNYFFGKHGAEFPCSKPVIDLDTNEEFESATDFALAHNLNVNSVTAVCRGTRSSIHGYRVRYKY